MDTVFSLMPMHVRTRDFCLGFGTRNKFESAQFLISIWTFKLKYMSWILLTTRNILKRLAYLLGIFILFLEPHLLIKCD